MQKKIKEFKEVFSTFFHQFFAYQHMLFIHNHRC